MPMKTMAVYIEYFQDNNFIAVFGKKICDSPRGCGKKVAKAYLLYFVGYMIQKVFDTGSRNSSGKGFGTISQAE